MCLQKRWVGPVNLASTFGGSVWGSHRRLLYTAIVVLGVIAAERISAGPIEIDLGPPQNVISQLSIPFDALNDTIVGGETMSFDLAITNSNFVRLFTLTSSSFDVLIKLQTNGTTKH